MEPSTHRLAELFRQLGLPDDPCAIEAFIAAHRPLAAGVPLPEAMFWSASQAAFLREKASEDADWAGLVDTLALRLSQAGPAPGTQVLPSEPHAPPSPLLQALYQRRSVREYTPAIVQPEAIQQLLEAAVRAPTAMHREPWCFAVIQNRLQLQHYSEQAKALLCRQQAEAGPDSPSKLSLLADPKFNIFYDAGTLIVIGHGAATDAFADADCWLAAQNLMLAATATGLGSCCIGLALPLLNQAAIKAEIGLPAEGSAVAAVIVGFARSVGTPTGRQPPRILSWVN